MLTSVDTKNKNACYKGGCEPYDRLLIATGAQSVLPPIGGLREAKNVFGLRDLAEAKAIRENAAKSDNIVIIGAGLVGLDVAYALVETGKKPMVIDMEDTLLALNLDSRAAAIYQTKFEEAGCAFYLGKMVADIECDSSGNATGVVLSDGTQLPCDMIVTAAGARPSVDFLEGSGIKCSKGVTVDEYLAAGAEGVYAAGDSTGLSGIWPNAVKQGEVAALNMCGIPTVYDDMFALKNTINFFGIVSLSVGQLTPCDGDAVYLREDRSRYEKVILRDGAVEGVILQGNVSHSGFWLYLIKNKINVAAIPKPVWKLSFADFYGIEKNGEYKWTVA